MEIPMSLFTSIYDTITSEKAKWVAIMHQMKQTIGGKGAEKNEGKEEKGNDIKKE